MEKKFDSPDNPGYLVHFVGRHRGDQPVPEGVPSSNADRLNQILAGGAIRGFRVPNTTYPVACLSELSIQAMVTAMQHGLNIRGPVPPWAIVLDRDQLWDNGVRPVWYLDWRQVRDIGRLAADGLIPHSLADLRTSREPDVNDWIYEREWRLCQGYDSASTNAKWALLFPRSAVKAVIVGEPGWNPVSLFHHPPETHIERWCWTGTDPDFDERAHNSIMLDGTITAPTVVA